MTVATFKIADIVRCAVEVPDGAVNVDLTKERDEVIPIILMADSSRSWNLAVAFEMTRDLGYRKGPVIVDLMLLNGLNAENRFMQYTYGVEGERDKYEIIQASPALRKRCNTLAQQMMDQVGIAHVLTKAQVYAVRHGIVPYQRESE